MKGPQNKSRTEMWEKQKPGGRKSRSLPCPRPQLCTLVPCPTLLCWGWDLPAFTGKNGKSPAGGLPRESAPWEGVIIFKYLAYVPLECWTPICTSNICQLMPCELLKDRAVTGNTERLLYSFAHETNIALLEISLLKLGATLLWSAFQLAVFPTETSCNSHGFTLRRWYFIFSTVCSKSILSIFAT